MNRHPGIGHDRFRPRCRDFEEAPRLLDDLIANVIKLSLLRLRNDLLIRQRRLRSRIPIDHPPSAINQPFAIKIDKHRLDGADVIIVEGVALPRPVARAPSRLSC